MELRLRLFHYLDEDVGLHVSVEVGEASCSRDAAVQLFDGGLSLVRLSNDPVDVVKEVGVHQLNVVGELEPERSSSVVPARKWYIGVKGLITCCR